MELLPLQDAALLLAVHEHFVTAGSVHANISDATAPPTSQSPSSATHFDSAAAEAVAATVSLHG